MQSQSTSGYTHITGKLSVPGLDRGALLDDRRCIEYEDFFRLVNLLTFADLLVFLCGALSLF